MKAYNKHRFTSVRFHLVLSVALAALALGHHAALAQGKPYDVTFVNATRGNVQMWVVSDPQEFLGTLPPNMSDTIDFNFNEQVAVYQTGSNLLLGSLTVRENTTLVIQNQTRGSGANGGGGGNGGIGGGNGGIGSGNGGIGGSGTGGTQRQLNLQTEIQDAIDYLNQIRANPTSFGGQLGVDFSSVQPRHALKPNSTLQQVAQRKAEWMAANDPQRTLASVQHVMTIDGQSVGMNQWLREAGWNMPIYAIDSMSHFESLWATGGTERIQPGVGRSVINTFVQEGVTGGHAQHVLGLSWNADNTEIGIGMALSPDGTYIYVSLLSWPKT